MNKKSVTSYLLRLSNERVSQNSLKYVSTGKSTFFNNFRPFLLKNFRAIFKNPQCSCKGLMIC